MERKEYYSPQYTDYALITHQLRMKHKEVLLKAKRTFSISTNCKAPDATYTLPQQAITDESTIQILNSITQFLNTHEKSSANQIFNTPQLCKLINLINSENNTISLLSSKIIAKLSEFSHLCCSHCVNNSKMPIITNRMKNTNDEQRIILIWIIANIAAESVEFRDKIIEYGIHRNITPYLDNYELMESCTWLLCNLCYGSPPPSLLFAECAFPLIFRQLDKPDIDVAKYALWGIYYIRKSGIALKMQHLDKLCSLLENTDSELLFPLLRILTSIASNDMLSLLMRNSLVSRLHNAIENTEECDTQVLIYDFLDFIVIEHRSIVSQCIKCGLVLSALHRIGSEYYNLRIASAKFAIDCALSADIQCLNKLVSSGIMHSIYLLITSFKSSHCLSNHILRFIKWISVALQEQTSFMHKAEIIQILYEINHSTDAQLQEEAACLLEAVRDDSTVDYKQLV